MKAVIVFLGLVLGIFSSMACKAENEVVITQSEDGGIECLHILPMNLLSNPVNGDMQVSAVCSMKEDSATIFVNYMQENNVPLDSMAVVVNGEVVRGEIQQMGYNKKHNTFLYSFKISREDFWVVFDGVSKPRFFLCSGKKSYRYDCKNSEWRGVMPQVAEKIREVKSDERYAVVRK